MHDRDRKLDMIRDVTAQWASLAGVKCELIRSWPGQPLISVVLLSWPEWLDPKKDVTSRVNFSLLAEELAGTDAQVADLARCRWQSAMYALWDLVYKHAKESIAEDVQSQKACA